MPPSTHVHVSMGGMTVFMAPPFLGIRRAAWQKIFPAFRKLELSNVWLKNPTVQNPRCHARACETQNRLTWQ
jgi:hypothetical protein